MDWPQYGPQKLEPLEYLYEKKKKNQKRYKEKGPTPQKNEKVMKLTSHAAAMDLMVEFSGDGVVPRERLGPIPQLFVGTSAKQRVEQFMAHRQVVQYLEHLNQHRDRNGEQHNGLQGAHHVEQLDGSNWNELTQSAQRDLQTR